VRLDEDDMVAAAAIIPDEPGNGEEADAQGTLPLQ
jgi:hypothetical protein